MVGRASVRSVGDLDGIVVGGGHNGLTAAAYLAQEGRRVTVLEARDTVGGFCASVDNVAEAPGFIMNPYAADHVLTNIPPTVDDELDLGAEGLRWVHPDPFYSHLGPDGGSIVFWRDYRRTVADIRRFSPGDAERYARFTEIMTDLWRTVYPYLQGHPRRVRPRALAHILGNMIKRRGNLADAARLMLGSPGSIIDEWFTSPQLRAALACFAVSTMSALDEPGSGIVLSMMAVQHQWGVRRPVGGNQAFSEALAAKVRRHGGQVRTGARVAAIDTRAGTVTGVTLADGEQLTAPTVVCTLDPWTMCHRLLPEGELPEAVYAQLRGMSVLRSNISAFKGDVALSRRPSLGKQARDDADLLGTVMLFAPDLEYVRRSTSAALVGELADEIPMWLAAPSVTDRTLVPPGSDGETLYVFLPAVPYQLNTGEWGTEKDKHLDRCLTIANEYLPGLSDAVIGTQATSPVDLETESSLHKGHLFHVDMTLGQFGPWRPVPGLSGYRTPIKGLFHSGAGSHPMGTLSGWSGRTTAREVLRRQR